MINTAWPTVPSIAEIQLHNRWEEVQSRQKQVSTTKMQEVNCWEALIKVWISIKHHKRKGLKSESINNRERSYLIKSYRNWIAAWNKRRMFSLSSQISKKQEWILATIIVFKDKDKKISIKRTRNGLKLIMQQSMLWIKAHNSVFQTRKLFSSIRFCTILLANGNQWRLRFNCKPQL